MIGLLGVCNLGIENRMTPDTFRSLKKRGFTPEQIQHWWGIHPINLRRLQRGKDVLTTDDPKFAQQRRRWSRLCAKKRAMAGAK